MITFRHTPSTPQEEFSPNLAGPQVKRPEQGPEPIAVRLRHHRPMACSHGNGETSSSEKPAGPDICSSVRGSTEVLGCLQQRLREASQLMLPLFGRAG